MAHAARTPLAASQPEAPLIPGSSLRLHGKLYLVASSSVGKRLSLATVYDPLECQLDIEVDVIIMCRWEAWVEGHGPAGFQPAAGPQYYPHPCETETSLPLTYMHESAHSIAATGI